MKAKASLSILFVLAACAGVEAPPPVGAVAPADAPAVPPAMQWLYGSGEGAASSLQTYNAFRDHVLAAARSRPAYGVVLAPGSTLDRARFMPCGARPLAVMLDVDETAIQNLGYEYGEAVRGPSHDSMRLNRWHQTGAALVEPMPGAVDALRAIREAGIVVIFNSNRLAAYAAATAAALDQAGLGPATHGDTLYLKGDIAPGSGKDPRRAAAAARYCVLALAGDQLGDFSDLFNRAGLQVAERRRSVSAEPFASLWGRGWFMLSNPVYGPSLRGGFDDIFPVDRRWSDPEGEN